MDAGGHSWRRWRKRITAHVAESQHRNAYYLMANTGVGAAVGVLFWLLVTRVANLDPFQVGLGYATIALGTTVGLIAKGGLDLALLKAVPGASRVEATRLLRYGTGLGVAGALALTLIIAAVSVFGGWSRQAAGPGWILVASIGCLLVMTWLQDAYFLAEGRARHTLERNLVFSAARFVLPVILVMFALPHPIALTWAIALAASAAAAAFIMARLPHRDGRQVPRREFVTSAARNVSGSAAEFLPGLVLAPLVLALDGEESAAYFGIAWTAASVLFLASAAISRAALAEMVRGGATSHAAAIRRTVVQHAWLLLPAAIFTAAIAPYALALFGAEYAREGALVLSILCASLVVVAPSYLYLAVLRAQERPWPLILFPAAMVATLAVIVPLLESRWGLEGVAIAWSVAHAPFGAYASWKLMTLAREVSPHGVPATLHRAPHAE